MQACLILKNNVVYLRSACCNNVFSLVQIDVRCYHGSTLPTTSSWVENHEIWSVDSQQNN